MNSVNSFITFFLLAIYSASSVTAQEPDSSNKFHPFLTDTFHIGLGVYGADKKVELRVGGGPDVEENINSSDSQSTGLLDFRWRFTENWSFWGQYWSLESEASKVLNSDIEFGEAIFPAGGTGIRTGVDTSIARLFFGRSIFKKPNSEFGIGAGIHLLKIDVFIEGRATWTDPGGTMQDSFRHEDVATALPLPNLGAWYAYSWSPKWIVTARLDWFDIEIGKYSGRLLNSEVAVNYQFAKYAGIGLGVNAFNIRADVTESGWTGGFESTQLGPRLALSFSW
jgi:hypothetical protein